MLNPGDVLGGCRIIAKIGGGGMGTVYRAEQLSLRREVAVKVMSAAMQGDVEAGERFLREARTAAAVTHANVVSIINVGIEDDKLFLVQELVTGGSAKDLLVASGGILGERRAMELIFDCCAGLHAIYEAGLIHRDVKPENILLTGDGSAKLADFGLARPVENRDQLTMTGASMGTPAFMSPEQAQGAKNLDIRSDIFSLGATLYCLVTGSAPFKGDTVWSIVAKMLTEPTPDPRKDHPGLSSGVAAVIMRAMAKDPSERYPTPRLMRQVLENLLRRKSNASDTHPTAPLNPTPYRSNTTRQTLPASAVAAKNIPPPTTVSAQQREKEIAHTESIPRAHTSDKHQKLAANKPAPRTAAAKPTAHAPAATHPHPHPHRTGHARTPRRSPILIPGIIGLAAMIGALIAVMIMGSNQKPPAAIPTSSANATNSANATSPIKNDIATPEPITKPIPDTPAKNTTRTNNQATVPKSAPVAKVPLIKPVPLINRGATWRYHDTGNDVTTTWHSADYSDTAWKSGSAPLGYGDPWIKTTVGFGADVNNKHITTYFLHQFTVSADHPFTSLEAFVMRDDGIVLYLNGREIARSNMPSGLVDFSTPASSVIGNAEESKYVSIRLTPSDLVPGTNILAVEIHQSSGISSDLSFDLELVGK